MIDDDLDAQHFERIFRPLLLGDVFRGAVNRAVQLVIRMSIESQRDALADRDFAGVDFIDVAVRAHAREVGDLDHALHLPARVADFFLVAAAPIRDVDDGAVARREHRHLADRILGPRDDRRRALLFAFEQQNLGACGAVERVDARENVCDLALRKRKVELDLFALVQLLEIGRRLQLQTRFAQTRFRFGEAEAFVGGAHCEIGAASLDFFQRLLAFGAVLLEPFLQFRRVESENRLPLFHLGTFRRHHRNLEVPDVVDLRRAEAAGVDRGERAGDVDAGDEIAARDADPVALTVGGELVAQRPAAEQKERGDRQRNGDAQAKHLTHRVPPERARASDDRLHSGR